MLINAKNDNFFKYFLTTTLKDIEVDESFCPLDEALFIHTGVYEESDRGDYEICVIKAGSRVWTYLVPNNQYYITDGQNSHVCHASVDASFLKLV